MLNKNKCCFYLIYSFYKSNLGKPMFRNNKDKKGAGGYMEDIKDF